MITDLDRLAAEYSIMSAIRDENFSEVEDVDSSNIFNGSVRIFLRAVQSALLEHTGDEPLNTVDICETVEGGLRRFNNEMKRLESELGGHWVPLVRAPDILREAVRLRRLESLTARVAEAGRQGDDETVRSLAQDILENGPIKSTEDFFRPVSAFPATIPEVDWLVADLIPSIGLSFLAGQPKQARKTTLATALAVSTASGRDWLGKTVKQGSVLYLAAEESEGSVLRRIRWLMTGLDLSVIDERQVQDNLFIGCGPRWTLDSTAGQNALTRAARSVKPQLIVLDPLSRLFIGDENSRSDIEPIVDFLKKLFFRFECSILVIHHSSKQAAATSGLDPLRGSSALRAAHDALIASSPLEDGAVLLRYEGRFNEHPSIITRIQYSEIHRSITLETEQPEIQPTGEQAVSLAFKVFDMLENSPNGLSTSFIAKQAGRNYSTVKKALGGLQSSGRITQRDGRAIKSDGTPYTTKLWFLKNGDGYGQKSFNY